VGLVDQVISLGSIVAISRKWGLEPNPSNTSEWILYTLLSVLGRVDILMFATFSLAGILKLTEWGTKALQQMLGNQWNLAYSIRLESLFFEGLVLGSFLVCLVVTYFTELPLSTVAALGGLVAIDLILYYCLVRILLVWRRGEGNDDEANMTEEMTRTNDLELSLEESA
jgi:hypothetical protein